MITLLLTPQPAPRPRFSKFGTYNSKKYTEYKEAIQMLVLSKKMPFFYTEALDLEVVFYMPIPESFSKKKRVALDGAYHVKRPDTDNLLKAFKDALNGTLYRDDSQISSLYAKKLYSFTPRIEFEIRKIDV